MKQPDKPFDMPALAADFAARHVACRADLQTGQEFPSDLWRKMGKAGLFRAGLPEKYGGDSCGYLDLLRSGEAFVRSGLNLGLGMSWIFQQIIARSVVGTFGTPEQCRQYLRAAALGDCTISFAVSEPGRGASPKTLATKAHQQGASYLLTGEKTYLTNGPIADLFVVVAVTDDASARKGFTAFMVARGAQGLFVEPPMPLNFLKPSPHGGIQLNHCLIPKTSVLGREGNAWEDMVVPLGETEDVVMMGPVLGGMAAQLDLLTAALREQSTDRSLQGEWGALHGAVRGASLMKQPPDSTGATDRLHRWALPSPASRRGFTPTSPGGPNDSIFNYPNASAFYKKTWHFWKCFKKDACKSVRKKSAPPC